MWFRIVSLGSSERLLKRALSCTESVFCLAICTGDIEIWDAGRIEKCDPLRAPNGSKWKWNGARAHAGCESDSDVGVVANQADGGAVCASPLAKDEFWDSPLPPPYPLPWQSHPGATPASVEAESQNEIQNESQNDSE